MKPVRVATSDTVYIGPPGVADLHCQRLDDNGRRVIRSVWRFSPAERASVAAGANVELWIWGEPIPPVGLGLTGDQGVGEDAEEALARLEEFKSRQGAT